MSTDQTPTKGAPPQAPDPIFSAEEVERILAFHGTPVAAQVLREVLGSLGRTAAYLARKQPKNRPEEFRSWNPPALRALAELCTRYAPEVGSVNVPRDEDMFPDATSPTEAGQRDLGPALAEIAAHEQQVLAERNGGHVVVPSADPPRSLGGLLGQGVETVRTVLDAEVIPPAEIEMVGPEHARIHAPDPVSEAEWEALAAPVGLPAIHRPDPPLDGASWIGREQGEPPF